MKPLIFVFLIVNSAFGAWKPLRVVKEVLIGKYGVTFSLGATGAANAFDYKTSIILDAAHVGQETNTLLLNKQGTLSVDRLEVAKALDFGIPAAAELWLKWKHPAAFVKYRPLIIFGNYVNAGMIGKAAYGNQQIIVRVLK